MRKLIGLAVSAAILVALYAFVDVAAMGRAVRAADPIWLSLGILFVLPLTCLTSWRLTLLVADVRLGFLASNRLILAASTLNLVLPSKLGDLAKAHVLSRRHGLRPSLAFAIVLLEKGLDMMSLLVWGVFGLIVVGMREPAMLLFLLPVAAGCLALLGLILPLPILPFLLARLSRLVPSRLGGATAAFAASWDEVTTWFWRTPGRAIGVVGLSILLWAAHLFQFWLFTRALGAVVPILANAAFATLSILAGLLPFTFAGIGTRDAAIVYFYAGYLSPADAAALGILATLRYVLPAIAGAPFVADLAGLARGAPTPGPDDIRPRPARR